MPPRIARLAGLGALGAAAGIALLVLLFVFATRPTEYAGLDWTHRTLSWMAMAGIALALIGVHVVFARQLLAIGAGRRETI